MQAKTMAKMLQVSEATVSRLASGERQPGMEVLLRIGGILRWSVDIQLDMLVHRPLDWAAQFQQQMRLAAPHPTCHETTTHEELARGERNFMCGLDCPHDD
jgi:transcriptional regulator with XRE-family HTH domain